MASLEANHTVFCLLNTRLNRRLTHPTKGVWATPDRREAEDMLNACRQYLAASGLEGIQEGFVIEEVDVSTL